MTDQVHRERGDRRQLSLTEAAVLFTLLVQIGALIWGAATLTETVRNLGSQVGDVRTAVHSLSDRVDQLSIDVKVLQDHDNQRTRGH